MRNPLRTPLGAVFQAELLLSSRRVAPYAVAVLFSANAALWVLAGPAASRGWAINSDFYIIRLYAGFCFMTLPFFVALIMGDPVVKDYRMGIDPLLFSKPVGRGEYLFGKFLGSFLVLLLCLACFGVTACLLQTLAGTGRVALPARILPYVVHFAMLVVVSALAMAAVCFTIGTLTRSIRIVYGLVACGYLLYIAGQIAIKDLPLSRRILLDPLMFNLSELYKGRSAESLNLLVVDYTGGMLANRLSMLLLSVACLAVLYARFSTLERPARGLPDGGTSLLQLSSAAPLETSLPKVRSVTQGVRARIGQLRAAAVLELRLLMAERSLLAFILLAALVCFASLAYRDVAAEKTYTAAYATGTAESISLLMLAIAIFYTGETLHRDRESRVDSMLWSAPAPDSVFILSKLIAMLALSLLLIVALCLTAIVMQITRGHAPVDVSLYLVIGLVIQIPNALFLIAGSTALHHLLRDKHLAYAASLGITGGLFTLFQLGYNHPLYNPVLQGRWAPSDLAIGSEPLIRILVHRLYCLALATLCLSLAHLFFGRPAGSSGRLGGRGGALLTMLLAALSAVVAGVMVSAAG